MSGAKHTPGPWEVKGDGFFGYFVAAPSFHGDAYDSVVLGDDEYREEGAERNRADAQIVAAAPDLLEAAELAEVIYAELGSALPTIVNTPSFDLVMDAVKRIRAAVAKAKGETP